jgi:hypothetical protein
MRRDRRQTTAAPRERPPARLVALGLCAFCACRLLARFPEAPDSDAAPDADSGGDADSDSDVDADADSGGDPGCDADSVDDWDGFDADTECVDLRLERCNGLDDDRCEASPDGVGEALFGQACCRGHVRCRDGALVCSPECGGRGWCGCPASPDDMVEIVDGDTRFCIDRWEAVVDESGRAATHAGALPATVISHSEAANACVRAGKRLCTSAEWRFACRNGVGTAYPYGDEYDPGRCNGADEPWQVLVTLTGSFAGCVGGDAGLFDMSGNVGEWTSDVAAGGLARSYGGSAVDHGDRLTCDSYEEAHVESTGVASGFRCCSAP